MHRRQDEWIQASALNSKKLYIDALNFNEAFGFTLKKWDIRYAKKLITAFVNATKQSSLTIEVFINAGIESDEDLAKWKQRREEEIKMERKVVPQGNSVILGDIFRSLGVDVLYSEKHDLDDCLASYAQHDGAAILSNDGDYFRYRQRKWEQFGKFKINEQGQLLLLRRFENKSKEQPSPRNILTPKPEMLLQDPSMNSVASLKIYRRGIPSALVKLCGNPHGKVVPLRRGVYAKLGIKEKVREEWPEWKENKVEWHIEDVTQDTEALSYFELSPQVLFEKFFFR